MSLTAPHTVDPSDIAVAGVGSAGNNVVNRIQNTDTHGIRSIALNTDKQHLKMVNADTKLLIGKSLTHGLGAGGDPSMGRRAATMAHGSIKEVFCGAELVFVTAGMGGGTGTGAAPVVSKIAKEQGALVIGMVTTPFDEERARTVKAEEGLEQMRNKADSTIVLDSNRLLEYVPKLTVGKAFSVMDQIIAETTLNLVPAATGESLLECDFAAVRSAFSASGIGTLLTGEADSDRVKVLVADVVEHPLLDIDRSVISQGCILVTSGPRLTAERARSIVNEVRTELELDPESPAAAYGDIQRSGQTMVQVLVTDIE